MNQADKNKQQVTHSPIVAKAAVKLPSGRIVQLVIFNESTRHEFYFAFQSKAIRSPRRAWKCGTYYQRDILANVKVYSDFHSFVNWYAQLHCGQVLSVRVHQPRRLSALYLKVQHESIMSDWTPRDDALATFDIVYKRHHRGVSGHLARRTVLSGGY